MPTTQSKSTASSFDAAFERANQAGEQFSAATRRAGTLYLDSYEKAVDRTIDIERKLAGASQQEWLKNLVDVQTEMAREFTGTYLSTARTLLK
ncbi:MAG: hypothetical protein M3016_01340 [Actinomycetota bacterium]|nr:hypothetical protein [Actinomycetota bacterium]